MADTAMSPKEIARNFEQDADDVYEALDRLHDRGYVRLNGAFCYEPTVEGEQKAIIRGSDPANA